MNLELRAQIVELRVMLPQNFEKIAGGAGSRRLTEGVFDFSFLNAGGKI